MKAKQPKKAPNPPNFPKDDAKTSGVVTRGNGAATKGKTARGPMA